jgi:hypothetical protein
MVASCEHGNEPSISIKCVKFLDQMSNYQKLKKGSAPWSYFIAVQVQLVILKTANLN